MKVFRLFSTLVVFVGLFALMSVTRITITRHLPDGQSIKEAFDIGEYIAVQFGPTFQPGTIRDFVGVAVKVVLAGGGSAVVGRRYIRKWPKEWGPYPKKGKKKKK